MDNNAVLRAKLDTARTLAVMADQSGAEGQVVTVLGDLRRLIQTAQSAQETAVRILRSRGQSWEQVGDALGMTRQGAHKVYGP